MILQLLRRLFPPTGLPRRLALLICCTIVLNVVFGFAFYFAERGVQPDLTMGDALWWAMVTMTTVGYGDFYAQTVVGRYFVSYPTFLLGIGLLGYFVGSVAEVVIETASARRQGRASVKMKEHILICGFPSASKVRQIVREIRVVPAFAKKPIVVVTDKVDRLPDELESEGLRFVQGSPLSDEILLKAGVRECEGAFILSENPNDPDADARTFAIAAMIEGIEAERGRPLRTVCEIGAARSRSMIKRAHTDGVVVHEGMTDCLLVQEYLNPGMMEVFQEIISNAVGSQFYLVETRLAGRQIRDLQKAVLDHPHDLQVVGLIRAGKTHLNPSKETTIAEGDRLILLANRLRDFAEVEADILQRNA
jgi:voltage-gated potassium channel